VQFFGIKGRDAGPVLLRYMHGIVRGIRKTLLIICQQDEAVLQIRKFGIF